MTDSSEPPSSQRSRKSEVDKASESDTEPQTEQPSKRRKLSSGSEEERISPSRKKERLEAKPYTTSSDDATESKMSDEPEATKIITSDRPTLSIEQLPSSPSASPNTGGSTSAPPLPNESTPSTAPPLPNEPLPSGAPEDDGWEAVWDMTAQAYYFYNRFTQVTQWENPRVPDATATTPAPATTATPATAAKTKIRPAAEGGYNPAIHGDYDPNADYAIGDNKEEEDIVLAAQQAASAVAGNANGLEYSATAQFNRFTGKFQAAGVTPELHSDEAKAKRQMNAFFDVDAQANSHDGRSLKAERQSRKLTKSELKVFRERNKERKEERKRAWLRD